MSTQNNFRLRFAPSPTGFLHIGNLRTVLFGYLIAKSLGAKFILRIEDTDQKREVDGAIDSLLSILTWLGIDFDEGPHKHGDFGPYIQTQRLDKYQALTNELLAKDGAYHCFCTEERLTLMRQEQEAKKIAPRYDRHCRNLSANQINQKLAAGEKFVIRQKLPLSGEVCVYDELRGEIKFKAEDLDDQVLIKSNGIPTYHFANIVDDHLMEISHVTRGDEWLPSFPKNVLLYKAFGWEAPKYLHLPLILNKEGGKLSKRQGDVFVEQYRAKGYLPEALINFCALLGWHPKDNQEIMSFEEIKNKFSWQDLGVSPAVFDIEKLDYYNGQYIRQKSISELSTLCLPYFTDYQHLHMEKFSKYVSLAKDRLKKISDITELTSFLFNLPAYEKNLLIWKSLDLNTIHNNLTNILYKLDNITTEDWTLIKLEEIVLNWIKEQGLKNGDFLWPLRVALSGLKNSPGPFEIADALGREETLKRLKFAIEKTKA